MPRMFIVDTNVLVAGLITTQADSPTAHLLDATLDGRLIYPLSPDLLREYRAVMLPSGLARAHDGRATSTWPFPYPIPIATGWTVSKLVSHP